jgi:Tfp pilus assembly protein PilX
MKNRNQRGVAMVIALLSLLVLSTLAASIIFMTQNEIWTSMNYKLLTQSRYAAEAGLQKSADWFRNTYPVPSSYTSFDMTKSPVEFNSSPIVLSAMNGTTGNYPISSVQTAFDSALNAQPVNGMGVSATYSVAATLVSMKTVLSVGDQVKPVQVWEVRARGDVDAARDAQVELKAKVENVANPTFGYAAFGVAPVCGSVSVQGNAGTDSFDSRFGTYTTTQSNTGGDLGTNGNVYVGGTSTTVHGEVQSAVAGTGSCGGGSMTALETSGGATVTEGVEQLPAPVSYPTPAAPSPAPPTTNQLVSGSVNLCGTGANVIAGCTVTGANQIDFAPGSYGNVTINGNTLRLSAGTYTMNSLTLSGGAILQIVSGPVVLQLAGNSLVGAAPVLSFTGTSQLVNLTASASDFQVIYGGTRDIQLAGGVNAYGVVYAPNSNISFTGGSDWFGAVVGNTINDNGGVNLHYDRSLSDKFFIVGNFRVAAVSWQKY